MTINTSCCARVPGCDSFCMEAAIVNGLLVRMALRTFHLGGRRLMHGTLDVGMAIHAGEHAAVDRGFEFLGGNIQADWLAVELFGEGRIAVASQTVVVGGLLCAPGSKGKCDENRQKRDCAARRSLHRGLELL